jgi:hypothetical protein
MKYILLISLSLMLFESSAWAWGRRGHGMVCETAAYLISDLPKNEFLRNHSFDLSFYCNVPDFFWKEPETFQAENPNHYMDMEIFDRGLRGANQKEAFEMDRLAFNKKFPQIPEKAGRAWWRVRELFDFVSAAKEKLMKANGLKTEERHKLQGEWIVPFGAIGHYTGDLSMPMHATENHDGNITKQKGIHGFYEDKMVNYLFHAPQFDLETEVWKAAQKRWKKDHEMLAKKSLLELLQMETDESFKHLEEPLTLDRKYGRDEKKLAPFYKKMLVDRISAGAVFTAEVYRRLTGFDFDDNRFFIFVGTPKFIAPPK